jgi:cytidylate kinase
VTIAALYGSAGSVIGMQVAEELGVPFLDRAIPDAVMRRADLSKEAVDDVDEETSTKVERLTSWLARTSTMAGDSGGRVERLDAQDRMVRSHIEAVLAEASVAGGVVLGRGGMVVLRSVPWVLHVHLGGAANARIDQAMALHGISRKLAEERLKSEDRARTSYVRRAYGVNGEDPSWYHLMLDSTALAIDVCVDIISAASRARTREPRATTPI